MHGKALLMNKQESADLLWDRPYQANIRWTTWGDVLRTQQQMLGRSMYPWASPLPIEQGFPHLRFPPLVSKRPATLDIELSPYWQSWLYQLSLGEVTTAIPQHWAVTTHALPLSPEADSSSIALVFHIISCQSWQLAVTFSSYRDENIVVLHL